MREPNSAQGARKGRKLRCTGKGQSCQHNCCRWPFRVISGAGALECPTAPSEITLTRPLRRTMSSWCQQWGMRRFLLHGKERAFITPFSWQSKAGETSAARPKSFCVPHQWTLSDSHLTRADGASESRKVHVRHLSLNNLHWQLDFFCSVSLHQPQWELPQHKVSLGKVHFTKHSWVRQTGDLCEKM